VFRGVRDRYDGKARNPWNEIECGSNYARSMASWAGLLALSGYSFDAQRKVIGFRPKVRDGLVFRTFWSNAAAWGTAEFRDGQFSLAVLSGDIELAGIALPLGIGKVVATVNGAPFAADRTDEGIGFASIRLKRGDVLNVHAPDLSVERLRDVSDF
jgi:non-lysosomal glucosylceramidase